MKLAVQLYSLRVFAEKNGAEETLKLVSEAGYDGVEFAGFYGKTPAEMFPRTSAWRPSKRICPTSTNWA